MRRQHQSISSLPIRTDGWPPKWNQLYDQIKNLLLRYPSSGEAESFAKRMYDLVNCGWDDSDSEQIYLDLLNDVNGFSSKRTQQDEQMRMQEEARRQSEREAAEARRARQQQRDAEEAARQARQREREAEEAAQQARQKDRYRQTTPTPLTSAEVSNELQMRRDNIVSTMQYICDITGYKDIQGMAYVVKNDVDDMYRIAMEILDHKLYAARTSPSQRILTESAKDIVKMQLGAIISQIDAGRRQRYAAPQQEQRQWQNRPSIMTSIFLQMKLDSFRDNGEIVEWIIKTFQIDARPFPSVYGRYTPVSKCLLFFFSSGNSIPQFKSEYARCRSMMDDSGLLIMKTKLNQLAYNYGKAMRIGDGVFASEEVDFEAKWASMGGLGNVHNNRKGTLPLPISKKDLQSIYYSYWKPEGYGQSLETFYSDFFNAICSLLELRTPTGNKHIISFEKNWPSIIKGVKIMSLQLHTDKIGEHGNDKLQADAASSLRTVINWLLTKQKSESGIGLISMGRQATCFHCNKIIF